MVLAAGWSYTGHSGREALNLGSREGGALAVKRVFIPLIQPGFHQIADWLERAYPDAAAALRGGLEECFTINRFDIPRSLHRCLATSNIVDNPHSGVRDRTRRVLPLASRYAGALVSSGILGNRKIVSQDHGLPRSVGPQSDPRWIAVSHPAGGGVESP